MNQRNDEDASFREAAVILADRLPGLEVAAGTFAHEFNSLLSVILLDAGILLDGELGDAQRARILRIAEKARRGAELTASLLAASRSPRVEAADWDLLAIANVAARRIAEETGLAPGRPATRDGSSLRAHVDADAIVAAMLDVASALCAVARATTPSIAIEVGAVAAGPGARQPGAKVALRLVVQGSGEVAAAALGDDPGRDWPTRLAAAAGYARAGGGALHVFVEPSRGETIFEFNLPPAVREAVNEAVPAVLAATRLRILVVDDDIDLAEAMCEGLGISGHDAEACSSGAAALDLLAAKPLDAVVSDISMPGMSGYQLLDAVQDRWPGLPVVLMTGFSPTTAGGERRVPVRILQKPVEIPGLLAALASLAAGRRPG